MKPESQIAILKTVVQWQAKEIEALQKRVEAMEQDTITGTIQGDTETLTVTVPPRWEA